MDYQFVTTSGTVLTAIIYFYLGNNYLILFFDDEQSSSDSEVHRSTLSVTANKQNACPNATVRKGLSI